MCDEPRSRPRFPRARRTLDEEIGAVELVGALGQRPGGAKKDGRVRVVTARVHASLHGGSEVNAGVLQDRQGVDVRPQHDPPARSPGLQQGQSPGLGRTLEDLQPEPCQPLPNEARGVVLGKRDLGVPVKVSAVVDHLVEDVGGGLREPARPAHRRQTIGPSE